MILSFSSEALFLKHCSAMRMLWTWEGTCTAPQTTWERQAAGCLSLLTPHSHSITFLFAGPALIALRVYNTGFVFHPVPRPWRELLLMTVPGTNCEENQLFGRIKSMEARGPQHPEEKGGAVRGWDSREDSRLPFLETSQNRMSSAPPGITKS